VESYTAYTLIGTIEGESFAGAVLADATNQQAFYRRGEKLPDGAQIVKVNRTGYLSSGPTALPSRSSSSTIRRS